MSEPLNGTSERKKVAKRCGAKRVNERSKRPSGPLKTRLSVTKNAPTLYGVNKAGWGMMHPDCDIALSELRAKYV